MLADLHPQARFWLDVADKLLKLLAIMAGAAWAWMHYHRSRTYAQKLELQLTGSIFRKDGLYVEVQGELRNIGASRHTLQKRGTFCEIIAIHADMTQRELRFARVFERATAIEPGEAIRDLIYLKLDAEDDTMIWIRVNLRITGKQVEWSDSILLKVD